MNNTLRRKSFLNGIVAYIKDISNLLRLDFYRAFKDKSVLVISCVVAGYALFYTILLYVMGHFIPEAALNARDQLASSTQFSSMPYIIIVVLVCIFIGKDLSYGTIRNKIIAGYSKKQIYLSTLIVAWLVTMALMILAQAVTFALGVPLLSFPTGAPYPGMGDFWIRMGLGYLLISLAISIVVFVEMVTRNMMVGLIVGTVGFLVTPVLFGYIGSLLIELLGDKHWIFEVYECFFLYDSFVISSGGSFTGIGFYTPVDGQLALKTLISSVATLIALNWLGIYLFHKLDLK